MKTLPFTSGTTLTNVGVSYVQWKARPKAVRRGGAGVESGLSGGDSDQSHYCGLAPVVTPVFEFPVAEPPVAVPPTPAPPTVLLEVEPPTVLPPVVLPP